MKYLKYFESIIKGIDKRMGLFVDILDVLQVYNHLKDENIRFTTLFGNDDDTEDDCFLILIEGNDYTKLSCVDENGFKDYFITIYDTDGFSDNFFFNWFEPDKIEGEWKIINDLEEIKIMLDTNKYNL